MTINIYRANGYILDLSKDNFSRLEPMLRRDLQFTSKYAGGFSIEKPEPVQCYRVKLLKDSQTVRVKLPLAYGKQLVDKYRNLKIVDKSYYEEYEDFDKLVPRCPDLQHPKAHPDQRNFVPSTLNMLLENETAFLVAPTGAGKMSAAIWLAKQLKTQTLFITTDDKLVKQFKDELVNLAGMKPSNIGLIKGVTFDVDKPIVIGSLKTLIKREHMMKEFINRFGFVVFDEADVLGATQFSKVMFYCNAKYQLAQTATKDRLDGLSDVFMSHFGKDNIVYASGDALPLKLKVHSVNYPVSGSFMKPKTFKYGLHLSDEYLNMIAECAYKDYKAGRNVLVIGEYFFGLAKVKRRLLQLGMSVDLIGEWFGESEDKGGSRHLTKKLKSYLYQGKKDHNYYDNIRKTSKIILATYGSMNRGVNIPRLDCGYSITDRMSMKQAHGRLRRPKDESCPNKPVPIWHMFKHVKFRFAVEKTNKVLAEATKDSCIDLEYLN